MTDRVGQQLGNYQLIRLLGEGGFAEVYLGEHIHLGTQAAIKVLHTQLTSDDVDKFRTEARTIAHLIHPHIVRVLEFGVEGKTPFLVMDYAPNGTLRQRHPKGIALPLPLIVTYVKQVADALQYAHDEKLIHRDIKPDNMLLGRRNDILLSDFGIALVAQSSRYQSAQEMAGTMAYMAPEQIQGKPRPASDQYSLGIVVYEWLSGDRPFHGSLTELVGQHLSVPPPSLQEKVSMISPEVDRVVLIALAKDPKERFDSVQAFAMAFEQACRTVISHPVTFTSEIAAPNQPSPPVDTVAASPPSRLSQSIDVVIPTSQSPQPTNVVTPPSQTLPPTGMASPFLVPNVSPSSRRKSVPSVGPQPSKRGISRRAVVVGLAGLAIAGTGITWLMRSQGLQISQSLGTTLYTYHGHTDLVSSVAWSPNGERIASGSSDRTVQVWNAAEGGNVYTYRGHSSDVDAVAWSPDGKRIASGSLDATMQVWNAVDGGNVYTYDEITSDVDAVAWSPDGKRIASGSLDATVQVWNAVDGSSRYTYTGHSGQVSAVAWSPDGRRIASGSWDKTVQVWNAVDGSSRNIYTGHSGQVSAVAWSPDGKRIASGSLDGIVQVWDAADGRHVYTYRGHSNAVETVAWSPDSRRIASGSVDRTVQVWQPE